MFELYLAAQAAATTAQAAQTQGVIVYERAFFDAYQPNSAFDLIARVPGFSFDGGADVRGLDGAAGNVLIDGQRPSSKSDRLQDVLGRLPASQVARVELIRGGAPGIDMQGKTVVANVVLKTGTSMKGLAAVSNKAVYDGRNLPGARLEGSARFDGKTLEGTLVYGGFVDDGAGDGTRVRRDASGVPVRVGEVDADGDGVQNLASGSYETPLYGGKLRINGRYNSERFSFKQVDKSAAGTDIEKNFNDEYEREIGLRYTRDLGPRNSLEAVFLHQEEDEQFDADFRSGGFVAEFGQHSLTKEDIVRGVWKFRPTATLSFEGGAETAINTLEGKTAYAENGLAVALPSANVDVEEKRAQAFVTGTWRATPKLTAEAGLRLEKSTISSTGDVALEKDLKFLKPRLSISWAPIAQTQIRASIERKVSQLDFGDFVADSALTTGQVRAGNPDLDPEQSWNGELTLERRFWKDGVATLTLRHAELTDVIDRAPIFTASGDVYDSPANIGDGTDDSVSVTLNLPLEKFGVKGGLLKGEGTWTRSEVTDPTTGKARRKSGQHPIDWELAFSQDLPAKGVKWGLEAYGAWRETYYRFSEVETYKLRTFVITYVEYKPRPDITLRAEIDNLTARNFVRINQGYSGPRTTAPLAYTDTQNLEFGRIFFLRVRKTFG
ncbi:TonB-dependent receptor plug domain-containing protein [Caulobacter sp. DWR1-3-2b1]|uniref:TonB-dependent receptor plug domain-containing protein n=1 Tax=Caulobacter sp. DWR1-3-2b1 TaxID=2804670 RepID=UPI003CF4132D